MTIKDFKDKYGSEYRRLTGKPIFSALMSVLESEQPIRNSLDPTTVAANPQVGNDIFNRASGFEHCHRLLRDILAEEQKQEQPEEEYNTEEEL